MAELLEVVKQQLAGERVSRLSEEIGADEASTQSALAAALPLLIGGLSRNVQSSSEEARSLDAALDEDHDGSLLDSLSSLLGSGGGGQTGGLGGLLGGLLGGAGSGAGGSAGRGAGSGAGGGLLGGLLGGGSAGGASRRAVDSDGILRHILGDKRAPVERGVSQASGLDAQKVGALLALLAPVVMGALGRVKRQQNLGADGLSSLLERERRDLESQAPPTSQGGLLDLLNSRDDAQLSNTVADIGRALGGSLFGRRS